MNLPMASLKASGLVHTNTLISSLIERWYLSIFPLVCGWLGEFGAGDVRWEPHSSASCLRGSPIGKPTLLAPARTLPSNQHHSVQILLNSQRRGDESSNEETYKGTSIEGEDDINKVFGCLGEFGAGDGARTHGLNLGKVAL